MSKFHIVDIDDLMNHCGYGTSQTDANNGYGCNHPKQDETELCFEIDGYTYRGPRKEIEEAIKSGLHNIKQQGKCYPWSCPLGSWCNEQDLVDYDKDGDFEGCNPSDLVLISDETYNNIFKEGGKE